VTTLDLSSGPHTVQLLVSGAIGAVTYASDGAHATVNATTGLVTEGTVGTAVITATDAVGNTDTISIVTQA
jgi:hypothetical protein